MIHVSAHEVNQTLFSKMQQRRVLAAQRVFPLSLHSPSSDDDVEDVPRHSTIRSTIAPSTRIYTPVRRRMHPEKGFSELFQMVEISTTLDSRQSVDGSDSSCASALTMATSASSTSTNPWSASGFEEDEEQDR